MMGLLRPALTDGAAAMHAHGGLPAAAASLAMAAGPGGPALHALRQGAPPLQPVIVPAVGDLDHAGATPALRSSSTPSASSHAPHMFGPHQLFSPLPPPPPPQQQQQAPHASPFARPLAFAPLACGPPAPSPTLAARLSASPAPPGHHPLATHQQQQRAGLVTLPVAQLEQLRGRLDDLQQSIQRLQDAEQAVELGGKVGAIRTHLEHLLTHNAGAPTGPAAGLPGPAASQQQQQVVMMPPPLPLQQQYYAHLQMQQQLAQQQLAQQQQLFFFHQQQQHQQQQRQRHKRLATSAAAPRQAAASAAPSPAASQGPAKRPHLELPGGSVLDPPLEQAAAPTPPAAHAEVRGALPSVSRNLHEKASVPAVLACTKRGACVLALRVPLDLAGRRHGDAAGPDRRLGPGR